MHIGKSFFLRSTKGKTLKQAHFLHCIRAQSSWLRCKYLDFPVVGEKDHADSLVSPMDSVSTDISWISSSIYYCLQSKGMKIDQKAGRQFILFTKG